MTLTPEQIAQGWKLHDAFELTKAIAFVRAVEGAGDPLLKSPYSEAMRLAEGMAGDDDSASPVVTVG